MSSTTTLMTVEEFEKILDPPGGRYELHHGETIFVPPPPKLHALIERQLMLLLHHACPGWVVDKEFAFRPLPEYEVWVADVGIVNDQRWRATQDREWLSGAPDLVIEVLSPSNTVQEMNDRERICFQGGCREFWVVDPELRIVRVDTPDGQGRTYAANEEIPLSRFTDASLSVRTSSANRNGIRVDQVPKFDNDITPVCSGRRRHSRYCEDAG